ncbi:MAG: hypothetical protein H7A25_08790 [Leptospiraceae bacterium]|nr:hypothetical protein [Leptospiraceae bacterium]MCP5499986.1 hypothetical protein [Leptospiraceae bacterium]
MKPLQSICFSFFALFFFFFFFSLHAKNIFPIYLHTSEWRLVEGFEKTYLQNGIPKEKSVTVRKLPILPNNIFNTPISFKGIKEYSMETFFVLEAPDSNRDLALHFAGIGENWRIYLNGQLISSYFYVKDGKLQKYRYLRNLDISVSRGILKKGKNHLFIHLAGYPPSSFLSKNFLLGLTFKEGYTLDYERKILQEHEELGKILLDLIYLFFGAYHLFFYFRWKEKVYNLYFALFSFFLSIHFLSFSNLSNSLFTESTITVFSAYSSQPLALLLFLLFLRSYLLEGIAINRAVISFIILNSLILLGFLSFGPRAYQTFLIAWYFVALPQIIYILYFLIYSVYKKLKDAKLLLYGVFSLSLFLAWDILDTLFIHTSIRLMQYGYFTFISSIVLILANRFIELHKESETLNYELNEHKNAIQRFVPHEFIEVLGKKEAKDIQLGDSVDKEMTVLFSDIRSFTHISETINSREVFYFLNLYLKRMEKAIEINRGFVDKYLGDGILALYSDSEDSKFNSDERAILSAIEMQDKLKKFNKRIKNKLKFPEIKIGIGIHSGNLILGTVGSKRRIDTTVIGDTVNLASRLEALTRDYETSIIISENTYQQIKNPELFKIREVDYVRVKGRERSVKIFEVYNNNPKELITQKDKLQDLFSSAIENYRIQNFEMALSDFCKYKEALGTDAVSQLYIKRCEMFLQSPPPPDWQFYTDIAHK